MLRTLIQDLKDAASFSAAHNSDSVDASELKTLAVQVTATLSTPDADDFLSGTKEVQTLTFPAKADATAGDYFVVTDTAGNTWAAALDKTGADPAPTGAIYTAVNAARKVNVDISGATTAAEVAAAVEAAFDALTGVTSVLVTDDSAADGTMTFTGVNAGNVATAQVKNADDSGAGSITQATTTPGVTGVVDIAANTITIPGHAFATGAKGQFTTTGVLPTGLSAVTDYYLIVVDADTLKVASSAANALAGTPIDITTTGTGTQTFTPTALAGGTATLQKSVDGSNWFAEGSAQNITASTVLYFEKVDPSGKYYRIAYAITAGELTVQELFYGRADL